MKTIYLSLILGFVAIFSLHAQNLYDELVAPYAESYSTIPEDFFYANDFDFKMNSNHSQFSIFNSQLSTPSEDWLTNRFGANYADSQQGYLDTPYGDPENGLKIPIGKGVNILLFIIGLYACVIIFRKKMQINRFM